jgi:hypothetical protein
MQWYWYVLVSKIVHEIYIFNFVYLIIQNGILCEKGCEDPWLFFEVIMGSASKQVWKTLL